MQQSQFNVIKCKGNETWVFNTLTSAFIKIDTQTWESLSSCQDKDLLDMLVRQGIMVTDNKAELDKYRYIYYNRLFDNRTLAVTITPTMMCNFGCPYCFEGSHKTMPKMTEEVIVAVGKYIIEQSKKKTILINWFGGEPLLAFDVICEICDKLNEAHVEFCSSMVTNGSLLNEEKIRNLHKLNINHLQITLDGTAESHNSKRYYKGGRPSFDDIISNIANLLRMTSLKIVIQVGVDNNNPHAYEDVHAFIEQRFPEAMKEGRIVIGCNNIQNRTGFDCTGTCLTDEQLYQKEKKAIEEHSYPALMGKLPSLSLPCMYRKTNQPAIDPEGNIYHCLEHLGVPSYSVGNVCSGKMSFAKISGMAFMGDPFDDEECRKCNVLPVCGGGCPQDIMQCKNRNNKTYCSSHKKYLSEMLPYLYKRFIEKGQE